MKHYSLMIQEIGFHLDKKIIDMNETIQLLHPEGKKAVKIDVNK